MGLIGGRQVGLISRRKVGLRQIGGVGLTHAAVEEAALLRKERNPKFASS